MKQTLQSLSGAFVAVLLGISAANAQYCIPTYDVNCGAGDNINTFNLYNSGINHANSGCSPAGYGDYTTDPSLLGSLESQVSYNFMITHTYQTSQFVKIFIDFNDDEIFDEATELLFESASGSTGGLTQGTITIPAMAPINGVRMRIVNLFAGTPFACGFQGTYGETHDYTVNILPVPTCLVPSNPMTDNVTAYNADISWGAIGNGIGYNIEWGMPGFSPGTGNEVDSEMGVVGTTYQITSLIPSTTYEYYIQTDCDVVDGLSQWAGPISFTTPPSCEVVSNSYADNITINTADVNWNEVANGIGYNIEWGTPGFTPGTGNEVGAELAVTGDLYQITGLTPATDYEYYIQTDCDVVDGVSLWYGPVWFTTPCVPIATLPWEENFDALSSVGYGTFPNCWVSEDYGWGTADNFSFWWEDADALSPENYLYMEPGSDGYLFTPNFELIGGETYEFIFNWAGDSHSGWDGEVVVSQSQSASDAEVIGDPFVSYGEETTFEYQLEKYCFTPDVDGVYSFGFHVSESDWWYTMSIDDISVRQAASSVGTDADITVCEQSGMVNLDDLATITDFEGNWTFSSNPSALVNENELNVDVIPNTTVMATYLSNSCLADDVTATITVVQSVSAGEDGIMNNICMSQPIDLLGGLGGAFNLGGQWYNPSNQPIASSYINTGNLPGQQNYYYIVGNGGICPDDTSNVIVNVGTCNYLSIEDISASDFNVFPNPATSNVTVSGSFNANTVDYILTDLNGKQVLNATNVDATNNEIQIDLVNLTEGVYILKLNSSTEENYFRIVKQ